MTAQSISTITALETKWEKIILQLSAQNPSGYIILDAALAVELLDDMRSIKENLQQGK